MKLTNEQIESLLSKAPDGSTHLSLGCCFFVKKVLHSDFKWWDGQSWFTLSSPVEMDSLESLKEILQIRKENEQLKAQIEALCNESDEGVEE
jgi:hypothetical protein